MAQHFIKDSVIDSGSDGSCNAENIMGTKDVINGKGKIFGDYYVCAKKDHEEGGCKVLDFNEWSEIWRNCKEKDLHGPGSEPGPPAGQASILPLNQRCFPAVLTKFTKFKRRI